MGFAGIGVNSKQGLDNMALVHAGFQHDYLVFPSFWLFLVSSFYEHLRLDRWTVLDLAEVIGRLPQ